LTHNPKILFYDIEWEPAQAYVWRMWDENISPDQLINPGGLLCFSAVWSDTKEVIFYSKWEHGRQAMVEALHALFCEADAVVTYNGDRYDIPKSMGEFLLAGLTPPPPPTSIDLVKAVKKLGFPMARLAFIGPLLEVGSKIKHEGFPLWTAVMDGDVKAQGRMKRYCIQDSKLLVKLYKKIKPFIKNHPHLGSTKHECGACGSNHVQSRGYRRTKHYRIQRIQCQQCGSWSEGTRTKVT
jgi:hypothetical protein